MWLSKGKKMMRENQPHLRVQRLCMEPIYPIYETICQVVLCVMRYQLDSYIYLLLATINESFGCLRIPFTFKFCVANRNINLLLEKILNLSGKYLAILNIWLCDLDVTWQLIKGDLLHYHEQILTCRVTQSS